MKILMAAMGMDIGGAETHIAELSAELKKRGCDVIVASNGGAYVPRLEYCGIRHFAVPMNRRALGPMLRSLFLLRRIIREEKPDIVHAHARIPAFLCSLLHRTMKGFMFITTTHGVYGTEGLLRRLTSWGDKSIAVSADVRDYLINCYGIDPKDIYLTVNGIATDRFAPKPGGRAAARELGIPDGAPVICHVSRLDSASSLAARQLIDAMPELCSRLPGAVLVVAGGGDVYPELLRAAELRNQAAGRRAVIMTGPRTDIERLLASCDVFVGVSRAALEAMSCEKPVILAGSQGYIGVFSPDRLTLATETNFCCRGCALPAPWMLADDIVKVLSMPEERRAFLGRCGRALVVDRYSVKAMTDSCMLAYDSLLEFRYRVVMSGYYGFGNAGDEAILQAIHKNVYALGGIAVTVLSSDPKYTRGRYGYDTVDRFRIWQVIRAIRRCDALVSGGGSLLQDHTSTRSLLYYLSVIRLAKLCGKKVMIYANGIGPVSKPANRRRVRRVVDSVDVVTLRDRNSAAELRGMGVTREDLIVTADPVFTLGRIGAERVRALLSLGIPADRPFVGVSIREWPGGDGFIAEIAALCDMIYERLDRTVVFFVMQPKNDTVITEHARAAMRSPSFLVDGTQTAGELIGAMGEADFMVAMRLHTLIFSACGAVPMAGIVYDPKVSAYLEALGMPSAGSAESFSAREAFPVVAGVAENRAAMAEALRERLDVLESEAHRDERLLKELLEK